VNKSVVQRGASSGAVEYGEEEVKSGGGVLVRESGYSEECRGKGSKC